MSRIIDADKFIEWLDVGHLRSPSEICYSEGDVKVMIDMQPTVDENKIRHGEWETNREDIEWGNFLKRKRCSVCKKSPHFDKERYEFLLTNYCPNCGAKMGGKEHNV